MSPTYAQSDQTLNFYTQRIFFQIICNESEIRLYFPFPDWFETNEIKRKMVNAIWFQLDLTRLGEPHTHTRVLDCSNNGISKIYPRTMAIQIAPCVHPCAQFSSNRLDENPKKRSNRFWSKKSWTKKKLGLPFIHNFYKRSGVNPLMRGLSGGPNICPTETS